MNRDDAKTFLWAGIIAVAILLTAVGIVGAEEAPRAGVDCAQIRAKVAYHGKIVAYAWALSNGYSSKEIARIRKMWGSETAGNPNPAVLSPSGLFYSPKTGPVILPGAFCF
jgi:hypothetical protein